MKNKYLLTGITGFVGSNLSEYLKDDFSIQGVSRKKSKGLISYLSLIHI